LAHLTAVGVEGCGAAVTDDTIFALSTAPGKAGVAVVRLSGPGSQPGLQALTRREAPPPRTAVLRSIRDREGRLIDRGLVLWFPAPQSFTGEDCVEFHIHGGRAVVQALLDALGALPGFRLAEAGEFTRRAFHNQRLDLTAIEGLADLIAAETDSQFRLAQQQAGGHLARRIEEWRGRLVRVLAHVEAEIDFPEDDLPGGLSAAARNTVLSVSEELAAVLGDAVRGERLRDGFSVAILGAPNAGKSSLLNALVQRDVAIVSALPGTTRDIVEAHLDLGGYALILADTAGLRASADEIESEGIRRALARAEAADLRLWLVDATDPQLPPAAQKGEYIIVFNKIDLVEPAHIPPGALSVSVRTGFGMDALKARLLAWLSEQGGTAAPPLVARERQRNGLAQCRTALGEALQQQAAELAAESIREAVRALGRLTGRVDPEDLLDVIFRDFCIGK
jgi:tRNA modification GTPase